MGPAGEISLTPVLTQSVQPTPGTGIFAPGKYYGFLGVVTLDGGKKPDWSFCGSTTLGAYALTQETFLSADLLGGFSFTHNSADAGADFAYNFGGVSLGRLLHAPTFNNVLIGGKAGGTVLFVKGVKSGFGILFGLNAQF